MNEIVQVKQFCQYCRGLLSDILDYHSECHSITQEFNRIYAWEIFTRSFKKITSHRYDPFEFSDDEYDDSVRLSFVLSSSIYQAYGICKTCFWEGRYTLSISLHWTKNLQMCQDCWDRFWSTTMNIPDLVRDSLGNIMRVLHAPIIGTGINNRQDITFFNKKNLFEAQHNILSFLRYESLFGYRDLVGNARLNFSNLPQVSNEYISHCNQCLTYNWEYIDGMMVCYHCYKFYLIYDDLINYDHVVKRLEEYKKNYQPKLKSKKLIIYLNE